ANYPNATIPTNFDLDEKARDAFPSFYAALLDRTLEKHPKAIVTEYAWDASTCDPCPSPPLTAGEIATLGGNVLGETGGGDFVVTRLHARYTKEALGEDLVFREATPIAGGREERGAGGALEHGAAAGRAHDFQACDAAR